MAIGERELARQFGGRPGSVATRAAEMVDAALRFCQRKSGDRGRDAIVNALKLEDPLIHDCFRHSLASQSGEYLARLDETVMAVYTHSWGDAEEEGEERGRSLTEPIHLILHVRRHTAALAAAVASLDHELSARYRELVAPRAQKMASLLDVQVAEDRDVADGIGYGAVLRSLHSRPERLWSR